MTREDQFIVLVQTALLASAHDSSTAKKLTVGAAVSWMAQAMAASDLLPSDLSAKEAAYDFIGWALGGDDIPEWV